VRKFSVGLAAVSLLGMSMSAEAATILLDGDTPETGSLLMSQPLVTSAGIITLVTNDNFRWIAASVDAELQPAGAAGDTFSIRNADLAPPRLEFDFEVVEISFLYGGNIGGILVEALDINGQVVDFFQQDDTGEGEPTGPATLSGNGIRGLRWNDTRPASQFAGLDNIVLTTAPTVPNPGTVVPEPGTIGLMAAALMSLGALCRRRVSARR
jgi:hypothetical protein